MPQAQKARHESEYSQQHEGSSRAQVGDQDEGGQHGADEATCGGDRGEEPHRTAAIGQADDRKTHGVG